MFDLEGRIDEWRHGLARHGGLSGEVLDELESHLRESYSVFTDELPKEEAFGKALCALGENRALNSEFKKLDSLTSIENIMRNLVLGSLISIVGILVGTVMMGATPSVYFHMAELLGLIVVPIGITISSFGFQRFGKAAHCIVSARHFSKGSHVVLNRWVSATYATGCLVFLIGVAFAFTSAIDSSFLGRLSASFSALIYAIAFSELFLRSTVVKLQEQVEIAG